MSFRALGLVFSILVAGLSSLPPSAQAQEPGEFPKFNETRKYFGHWLGVCDLGTKACRVVGGSLDRENRFFWQTRVTVEYPKAGAVPLVTVFLGNQDGCPADATMTFRFDNGETFQYDGHMYENTCHTYDLPAGQEVTDAVIRGVRAHRSATVRVTYPDGSPAQTGTISLHGISAGLDWIQRRQPGL